VANAFLSGYLKRRYRGFVANDAVKSNWAKLIVGYAGAGTDADAKIYNLDCRSDFNDYALVRFTGTETNTRQKEWKEKHTADTSADKWFKITESYSSVLTGDAAASQKVVDVNDASGFAADDWCVIARDDGTDEFIQIDSISTNEITFKTNLANAYTTADNAKVMLGYYVYYDDSDDTTDYQDGANTFIVFDDFERGSDGELVSLNSDWTISQGVCELDTAIKYGGDKSAKILGGTTRLYAYVSVTASANIAIRYRYYKETAARYGFFLGDGSTETAMHFETDEDVEVYDGTGYQDIGLNCLADSWGLVEIRDFDWVGQTADYVVDGNVADDVDVSYASAGSTNIAVIEGDDVAGVDTWIDDFLVRNYPDIAGSGFGAEEKASTTYELSITDGIEVGETIAQNMVVNLALSDGMKGGDTLAQRLTLDTVITDGVALGETVNQNLTVNLSITDGMKGGDSLAHVATLNPTLADGVELSEALSALGIFNKGVTDGITFGDSLLAGADFELSITDGTVFSDAISHLYESNPTLGEGIDFGDTPITQWEGAVTVTDGITLSDTPAGRLVLSLALTDGVTLSDTTLISLALSLSMTDGLTLSESAAIFKTVIVQLSDGVSLGDVLAHLYTSYPALADGLTLGDAISTGGTFNLSLTDGVTLSDALLLGQIYSLLVADGFTMSDAAQLALYVRELARKYIVEIHDGDGNLVAVLENAHQINYTQNLNNPHSLRFNIPSDDSKESNITLANELWLRDYSSGLVVKKFRLNQTRDLRK